MSAFLTRVAERSLAESPPTGTVRPRPVSLFEPVAREPDFEDETMIGSPESNGHRPQPPPEQVAPQPKSAASEAPLARADARASPETSGPAADASLGPLPLEPPLEREPAVATDPDVTPADASAEGVLLPPSPPEHRRKSRVVEPPEPAASAEEGASVPPRPSDESHVVPRFAGEDTRSPGPLPAAGVEHEQLPTMWRAIAEERPAPSGHAVSRQRLGMPELLPARRRQAPAPFAGQPPSTLTPAEPVVQVSIGRVEIRAQETPSSRPSSTRSSRPVAMSLPEYLQRRSREAAR